MGSVVEVPEMMPAVCLDFEGNTDSIESKCNYLPGKNDEAVKALGNPVEGKLDVCRLMCRDFGGVKDYSGIDAFNKAINWLFSQDHPYNTVFVDSYSAFDFWLMQWVMKNFPCKRQNNDIPEYPDFRKIQMIHNEALYALLDAPFHVILTCQTYLEDKDEIIRPRLTGQARTALPGIFKQCAVMTALGGKRELHFQPYGRYFAKDCSEGGKFGAKIINPTLKQIYELRNK